ncbi:MAG: endonuclease/exonuclease/phosphatase family protein [Planctomycetes bacterium]|nr:endonuclease/exonuclease/phosphatase family protein [Planctomycetota bacterium]
MRSAVIVVWLLAHALAAAEPTLTLLTWNVLADPARAGERAPALVRTIAELNPDIVALQEVQPWLRAQIDASPALAHYRGTVVNGKVMAPGGLYLLSRLDVQSISIEVIPTRLDRCALIATIDVGAGPPLTLGIVHLDSLPGQDELRVMQLAAVQRRLAQAPLAALVGDFNFGDADPLESAALDPGWTDCWRAAMGEDPGLTWDNERNALARANAFPEEPSRRLDRVLVRSQRWTPVESRLVGTEAVSALTPGLFPSDHFGVYVRMIGPMP